MYYQTLVKNLFNDMHHFLNGVQAISLEDLKDNYQEEPLFLAFIGNLDQAAAVDYNAAMNESYAFYKKFCGKGLAEEDWDLVILEVQEFREHLVQRIDSCASGYSGPGGQRTERRRTGIGREFNTGGSRW